MFRLKGDKSIIILRIKEEEKIEWLLRMVTRRV